MKKKNIKLPETAYEIYQNHRQEPYYPSMISKFLEWSNSQFEKNRAVRMICDWLLQYKTMNQIMKHKYNNIIPKILKNFSDLFKRQADIYVCIAPFYYEFYFAWKQLTEIIIKNLQQSNAYTLKFLWYLSFDFCQKLDPDKQYEFNVHLSHMFQGALFKFFKNQDLDKMIKLNIQISNDKQVEYDEINLDQMTFKPLIQTVRMLNIQTPKKQFTDSSIHWAEKLQKIYQASNIKNLQIQLLIQIVGCRSFLVEGKGTDQFWIKMVNKYFTQIQNRVEKVLVNNQTDMKLLDSLELITNFESVKEYLVKHKKRFTISLLQYMKKHPDPKNPFHYHKFYSLRIRLINLFYFVDKDTSVKQMEDILTQFNKKYLSVLKDNQENTQFFDCMCQYKLQISKNNILDIIKSLSNSHSRKSFPVNVLIILVKLLHSVSEEQLSEQHLNSVIKSLSQCIASKINDNRIFDLRIEISRYYLTLAQKYLWNDQKTTQIMLVWCEQFQRNNKMSTSQTITLLRVLTKKHSSVVFSVFNHKLDTLIADITIKLKFNKVYENIPKLVSLLLCLYVDISWKQSHKYIKQICGGQSQDMTFLYLLQSQIVTRKTAIQQMLTAQLLAIQNAKNPQKSQGQTTGEIGPGSQLYYDIQQQKNQMRQILEQKQIWKKDQRVNVLLYYIQLYFDQISRQEYIQLIFQLDNHVLKLFQNLYEQASYHLMIHIAVRVFYKAGSLALLKKLKSFRFFREYSFDILSRSFHKKSILLMSYMYCCLIVRSDSPENFFAELNQDNFLDSLFQGCDDFIGKSSRFYQQTCYIILLFIYSKQNVKICGCSNILNYRQIHKNRNWWEQAKNWVSFRLPVDEDSTQSLLIDEFKEFYQNHIRDYFEKEVIASGDNSNNAKKDTQLDQEDGDI